MKRASFACLILIACSGAALADTSDEDRVTVPLSDPSRPGSLHIGLVTGEISVVGRDIKEVIIEMRGGSTKERPVPDEARGLRRLTQSATINIEEHNNRVEVSAPAMRAVRATMGTRTATIKHSHISSARNRSTSTLLTSRSVRRRRSGFQLRAAR